MKRVSLRRFIRREIAVLTEPVEVWSRMRCLGVWNPGEKSSEAEPAAVTGNPSPAQAAVLARQAARPVKPVRKMTASEILRKANGGAE